VTAEQIEDDHVFQTKLQLHLRYRRIILLRPLSFGCAGSLVESALPNLPPRWCVGQFAITENETGRVWRVIHVLAGFKSSGYYMLRVLSKLRGTILCTARQGSRPTDQSQVSELSWTMQINTLVKMVVFWVVAPCSCRSLQPWWRQEIPLKRR
jgi:hypothetical protein